MKLRLWRILEEADMEFNFIRTAGNLCRIMEKNVELKMLNYV